MHKDEFQLTINDYEKRILVVALDKLKDNQELENKHYDFIDSTIVKVSSAPRIKERYKFNAKQKER